MPVDLLGPTPKLAYAHLELTTRCNLRCVYCCRSYETDDKTSNMDFPHDLVPKLIEEMLECGLKYLRVSGVGETTVHPHWLAICRRFLDAGFDLEIVTNLAKKLNPEEVMLLGRFKRIFVSCDTVDPEIFALLRRGNKLDRFLGNLRAIKRESAARVGGPPILTMSTVVTDKVVFDLEKTIRVGLDLGIREFFLNDLAPAPDMAGSLQVRPAWTLPLEQVRKAKDCLESAIRLARDAGAAVVPTPGLLSALAGAADGTAPSASAIGIWSSPSPGIGETRCCLDLWRFAYITANGVVRACCVNDAPIMGDLREKSLQQILKDAPYRDFRAKHLAGKLPKVCGGCALVDIATTRSLRAKVSGILRDLSDTVHELLPGLKRKRVAIYGAGAHTGKLFRETELHTIPLIGIVDRNPLLHGKELEQLAIHPVEDLEEMRPEVIIISSLDFQDEIYDQLKGFRDRGVDTIRLYQE
jgi:MoaA/NifB/PqqE/SkfB family radical SAM enzyme